MVMVMIYSMNDFDDGDDNDMPRRDRWVASVRAAREPLKSIRDEIIITIFIIIIIIIIIIVMSVTVHNVMNVTIIMKRWILWKAFSQPFFQFPVLWWWRSVIKYGQR